MTPHDAMLEKVAAYALGALPVVDVVGVTEHLHGCDECTTEYRELLSAVTALAYSAQACETGEEGPQVSPLLKERIMQRVRSQNRIAKMRTRPVNAIAACIALALLGVAAFAWHPWTMRPGTGVVRRYAFAGGVLYVKKDRITIAQRLAPLPAGRVYQVWTLARGARRVSPSVTFPATSSTVNVAMDTVRLAAVAISVEPAGGSPQPTTKPVVFVHL